MARRTNYGFEKRKKEKEKQERAQKKRERRLERKEAGDLPPEHDPSIVPIDPADLGLAGGGSPAKVETEEEEGAEEEPQP